MHSWIQLSTSQYKLLQSWIRLTLNSRAMDGLGGPPSETKTISLFGLGHMFFAFSISYLTSRAHCRRKFCLLRTIWAQTSAEICPPKPIILATSLLNSQIQIDQTQMLHSLRQYTRSKKKTVILQTMKTK